MVETAPAILHLTDLHFGDEHRPAVPALRQLVQRLRPQALVVSGDLTQRATRAQFAAAAEFLDSLPVRRRLLLPGNHDLPLCALWTRLLAPQRRWLRQFGTWLPPRPLRLPGWHIVAADSVRVWRHRRGAVTAAECRRVAGLLAQGAPGALRAVAMHHPLAVRDPGRADQTVLRAHEAVAAWVQAGARLVLGGHVHDAYAHPWRGAGGRVLWAVQGGTALSRRLHGTPTQAVQTLQHEPSARAVLLRRWRFDGREGAFVDDGQQRLGLGDPVHPSSTPRPGRLSDASDTKRVGAPTPLQAIQS